MKRIAKFIALYLLLPLGYRVVALAAIIFGIAGLFYLGEKTMFFEWLSVTAIGVFVALFIAGGVRDQWTKFLAAERAARYSAAITAGVRENSNG